MVSLSLVALYFFSLLPSVVVSFHSTFPARAQVQVHGMASRGGAAAGVRHTRAGGGGHVHISPPADGQGPVTVHINRDGVMSLRPTPGQSAAVGAPAVGAVGDGDAMAYRANQMAAAKVHLQSARRREEQAGLGGQTHGGFSADTNRALYADAGQVIEVPMIPRGGGGHTTGGHDALAKSPLQSLRMTPGLVLGGVAYDEHAVPISPNRTGQGGGAEELVIGAAGGGAATSTAASTAAAIIQRRKERLGRRGNGGGGNAIANGGGGRSGMSPVTLAKSTPLPMGGSRHVSSSRSSSSRSNNKLANSRSPLCAAEQGWVNSKLFGSSHSQHMDNALDDLFVTNDAWGSRYSATRYAHNN